MSVIRTQYGVVSALTTVGATSQAVITLPRPSDAAENNTIDWTTRPAFRKEFESGRAVVTPDTLLGVAGVVLQKVEIVALNPGNSLAPLDLSFSQFPETDILTGVGFPTPVLRTILDVTALPTANNPYVMGGANATATLQLLATILLRADEYIRVTLFNTTGAPITGLLEARYDFGMNPGNYGSIPLLI